MKFHNLVAVIAILSLAAQANAADTTVVTENQPAQGVVIMNSNTNSNSSAAVAQPTTVVEASPVSESKADLMRKARQSEEVKTEQKIVEKLEESRLKEEQQRAERLFGNKLDGAPAVAAPAAAAATATAVATPNGAAATATAIAVEPDQKDEVKPTQVTIEKVEIIQPKEEPKAEVIEKPEAVSSMKLEPSQDEEKKDKFFAGAIVAVPSYSASNLKSNYGLGVSVGMNLRSNWVIEGSFVYSNHDLDTYWEYPGYKEMDQYDLGVTGKYYILSGKLKPYGGAGLTYIYRTYTNRSFISSYPGTDMTSTSEDTSAVNGLLTAGVDFEIAKNILLGAGLDYSMNLTNKQNFQAQYGLPSGVKLVEEIDYTLIKVTAKMTF